MSLYGVPRKACGLSKKVIEVDLFVSCSISSSTHQFDYSGTQYTTELLLTNVQRNDNRFQTVTCSTHDGHEKRKYLIDVACRDFSSFLD